MSFDCNPSIWGAEARDGALETSLDFIVRSCLKASNKLGPHMPALPKVLKA